MADEPNPDQREAEKQRLLAELEQNRPFQKKDRPRSKEIEDPNALAGLYRHTLGLTDEQPPDTGATTPKHITKITHYEIKAMKVSAATQEQTSVKTKKRFADFVIRAWFTIKSMFAHREDHRTRCQMEGHECLHCGARFSKVAEED